MLDSLPYRVKFDAGRVCSPGRLNSDSNEGDPYSTISSTDNMRPIEELMLDRPICGNDIPYAFVTSFNGGMSPSFLIDR
jgi:hypothetical protein